MSPNPLHERHAEIVKEAMSTALRWHELSISAAIELAARVARSQATIQRSRQILDRLNQEATPKSQRP